MRSFWGLGYVALEAALRVGVGALVSRSQKRLLLAAVLGG